LTIAAPHVWMTILYEYTLATNEDRRFGRQRQGYDTSFLICAFVAKSKYGRILPGEGSANGECLITTKCSAL
jgi:hypothetical protein